MSENICGCGCRCEACSPATDLRTRVALMRELGVLQWDGIVLGPAPGAATAPRPPRPEPTDDERQAAYDRTLFAASGVRPR